jgi:hypothetical protein
MSSNGMDGYLDLRNDFAFKQLFGTEETSPVERGEKYTIRKNRASKPILTLVANFYS